MQTASGTRTSKKQMIAQLEAIIGWTWRDRIGHVWHQLRATAEEMHYAARRNAELRMRLPR